MIPKPMRDILGLRPGDEVDFELTDRGVLVEPARPRRFLRGLLAGEDLVGARERDRRAEPR